jgi:uncharacterized coiled-coil protein SlyX
LSDVEKHLLSRVEELEDVVEEQADTIEELEQDRDRQAKELAENRQRIAELEDRLSDDDPHTSEGEDAHADGCVTPQTPLEQTVGLPDDMASNESANVQRAVFIASDVQDYTTSVPAGRAITSGELRRVLKAGTDCNGHSQTVDRVITVLDDMGQDAVKVVKRRGERRIVFDEELCHRLRELSQDERNANHGVVSGGRA